MTLDQMIAVLQAAKDGKQIEFRLVEWRRAGPDWCKIETEDNSWNFPSCEYRVKREPETIWVSLGDHSRVYAFPVAGATKFVEVIE